jgi:hypothetical protein
MEGVFTTERFIDGCADADGVAQMQRDMALVRHWVNGGRLVIQAQASGTKLEAIALVLETYAGGSMIDGWNM